MGLNFLFPGLLIAGAAVIAPVLIHLLLRPRPRPAEFPAIRFVLRSYRANVRRLRARQWLLLLLRMEVIVAAVMLLARPRLMRAVNRRDPGEPAAAVFVIDNSGSMNAVRHGRTALERAKALAQEVLDALPAGSRSAVLSGEDPRPAGGLSGDRALLAQQIADVAAGYGGRPLTGAIGRAAALLGEADLPRRELYVLTDMTAAAWRGADPAPNADETNVTLLDCGGEAVSNVAVEAVKLLAPRAVVDVAVDVQTMLSCEGVGGQFVVETELDGQTDDRKSVLLSPGGVATVRLRAIPRRAGTVHGRVSAAAADAMAADNVRYFTLQVSEPAELLIVRDGAVIAPGDDVSFLMAAAAAPPGSAELWARRRTITSEQLDAAVTATADIIMLADVGGLDEAQWSLLERRVRAGRGLWVVPGAAASPGAYNTAAARRVMPASLGPLEQLPAPTGWTAADWEHPLLRPFADEANPPLSQVLMTRRRAAGAAAADATVVLRYEDGAPAVIERAVGRGRAVLWNFSPAAEMSNLASLPQFPILVQRTLRVLGAEATGEAAVIWGRQVDVPVPADTPAATASIQRPGLASEQIVASEMRAAAVTIHADRLGGWTVRFVEGERQADRGFSVNVDPDESDLSSMDASHLSALVDRLDAAVAREGKQVVQRRRETSRPLDLAGPLLLALLAIVTVESLLANRYYRRATT